MSDLLAAASLLLAIVAVLSGMWYPEIVKSLETEPPVHEPARRKPYGEVAAVRRTRALPLMLVTVLLAALFFPEAVRIVDRSVHLAVAKPATALREYNAVATAFVLVEFLALGFAVYFTRVWMKFGDLLKKLS